LKRKVGQVQGNKARHHDQKIRQTIAIDGAQDHLGVIGRSCRIDIIMAQSGIKGGQTDPVAPSRRKFKDQVA